MLDWNGRQHGMELWTLAITLTLLKTKWDFFLDGMEGEGTLETQGFGSTEIKLPTISHPPI